MRVKYDKMDMEIENWIEDEVAERIAIEVVKKNTWSERRMILVAGLAMELTDLTPDQLAKIIERFGIDEFREAIKEKTINYNLIEEAIAFYDNPVIALRNIMHGINDAKNDIEKNNANKEEIAEEVKMQNE